MPSLKVLYTNAALSAAETLTGCRWVLDELVGNEAKRQIVIALFCLFVGATATSVAVPFVMRFVIDSENVGNKEATYLLLLALSGVLTVGTVFGSFHDHYRERAWNQNFFTVHTRLVRKMFERPYDEIISEQSEVGAEQIESVKDKVQNILYLFLFESSIVFSTIIGATIFLFLTSTLAAVVAVLQTIFNLVWFFFCNAALDAKMGALDEQFRRFSRRTVEKLHMVASVKAGGVENKTAMQVGEEIKKPLAEDLQIWAYWFQRVDFSRRLINTLTPVGILAYGVHESWTAGTLAAVSSLMFMISREYGFIGHLMRHLAAQVARIRATREALTKKPAFDYNTGIEFTEEKKHAY
ncbi:MAG: hypothetical protein AAB388_03435 [Patescibacteria group bacterium]